MSNIMTMKNMNAETTGTEVRYRVKKPERMLGRSLMQPFCNTNSGSRKLMHSTHLEQCLPLIEPEVPIIQTGYENQFGRYSSSYHEAEDDLIVLAKIQKFSEYNNHHYFLIVQNSKTKELDYIEKINYEFITETYGYLYDNSTLDRLEPISDMNNISNRNVIRSGQVYKKSNAFDEFNNRQNGINVNVAYMSTTKNTEDSMLISESTAKRLASPLIKPVIINVNENDILLNMYGDDYDHKSFPDIGEISKNNILTAVRREKREEALYTHSYARLNEILMSDEKFITSGQVVDIDIYCNNPETINSSVYHRQIKKYNDNKLRYMNEILLAVKNIQSMNNNELPVSYNLKKLLEEANMVLGGGQYINDRPFTGTILKITVMEKDEVKVGDKGAFRFGDKGVVSYIVPDELMPRIAHNGKPVDVILNSCTCVGRLNPGQMFESSITFIGNRIIDYILLNVLTPDEAMDLVREYMQLVGCKMDEFIEEMLDPNNPEEFKAEYLKSIVDDSGIMLSLEPISESMTINKLSNIYDVFSWAKPYEMIMPIKDSTGNIRYVKSRRPMIIGSRYLYRLKQYAEDKFSATSSSATNIRNLNTRSKANKQYKSPHTRTPIRFGDMESGNLNHMGNEIVAALMMMYSSSPHARRSVQKLYTDNPFDINIKLDNKSKNRNVEIINARLKTCGYKLQFKKIPKNMINPFMRITNPFMRITNPFERITPIVGRYTGEEEE